MKEKILIALGAVVAAAIIFFCGIQLSTKSYGATIQGQSNIFYSVSSSTQETVGTASTQILATSTGRTWARISNNSASAITCAYKNGAPATVQQGFIIGASSTPSFEMNQLTEPVYTGGISCISNTASAATIYVEVNQ